MDIPNHEIFRGVTLDGGATWSWTPITRNSGVDNWRPIVPAWDGQNTALLWFRGTATFFTNFDMAVVGVLDRHGEQSGLVHYVDATEGPDGNTTLATGAELIPTMGPGRGAADDNWHRRTGYGNGDSVLAANEEPPEDAPMLKTTLAGLSDGTYDIFVFFWANPAEDWRIQAGLAPDQMLLFREMASQQAEFGHFDTPVTLAGGGNTSLYRAYVGRVEVIEGEPIHVFIDDQAAYSDGRGRTWYDGVGYASVVWTGPADFDRDGDVDGDDLNLFSACHSGAALPPAADCARADLDGDLDVDQDDFGIFQRCLSGPRRASDPDCAR
jgi:hypothetical protein